MNEPPLTPTGAPATTALLVIDVQQALFEQKTPVYAADHLLCAINRLIAQARQVGAPVICFQHINKGILREAAPGWRLHPALNVAADDCLMTKRYGSAFKATVLHDTLQAYDISTLVVCGLTTHGCVRATCKDALGLGYRVVLVADAHSSYAQDAARHIDQWNRKLGDQGARVLAAQQIIF
ncbi:MAG: isochorismatase family protein [Chloroflexota bacterium]